SAILSGRHPPELTAPSHGRHAAGAAARTVGDKVMILPTWRRTRQHNLWAHWNRERGEAFQRPSPSECDLRSQPASGGHRPDQGRTSHKGENSEHRKRMQTMALKGKPRDRSPADGPKFTGIADCCARATSGHAAAAPPMSVMNSRRFIRSP